ncbi:Diphosphoinositol polyphosphate phosphohydrolase 1 [Penaeus vannamei]|uniref:Diphosphoinositol polyphosphate phosphohydrolase 1 n=1 Tax=Penaeus vannamei TaxID=6689 RepID=A0A423TDX1_PENVA|nr:Diphosphoinositol polyphosphate phosphohydrolase 1 [Penaeus vannamei]
MALVVVQSNLVLSVRFFSPLPPPPPPLILGAGQSPGCLSALLLHSHSPSSCYSSQGCLPPHFFLSNITFYPPLTQTKHHSGRKKHRTAVFVVVVKQIHAQYPEAHLGRARQWFSFEEALIQLSRNRPVQSAYLQLMLASRIKVPTT